MFGKLGKKNRTSSTPETASEYQKQVPTGSLGSADLAAIRTPSAGQAHKQVLAALWAKPLSWSNTRETGTPPAKYETFAQRLPQALAEAEAHLAQRPDAPTFNAPRPSQLTQPNAQPPSALPPTY